MRTTLSRSKKTALYLTGIALIAVPAVIGLPGPDALGAGPGDTGTAARAIGKNGSDGQAQLGEPAPVDAAAQAENRSRTSAGTDSAAPLATIPAIDRTNKAAVASAYRTYYLPARNTPMGWTGSVANCNPGSISAAAHTATFDTLNYLRRMAGLQPVTENANASSAARRTALIMQAKGNLSHWPPSNWPCWTNNGAFLASRSNIARGSGGDGILAGAKAIAAYVDDVGVDSLGHRRWSLSPGVTTMGSGSTSNANALVWGDSSGQCFPTSSCTTTTFNTSADPPFSFSYSTAWSSPQFVAWPGAGYFPYQLTDSDFSTATMDWSISTGSSLSFGGARVAVTKNGSTVNGLTIIPQSTLGVGYGDMGTFAFRFPANVVTKPAAGQVDTYHVAISSITGYSGTYQYDVRIFNPLEASVASVAITKADGSAADTPAVGTTLAAKLGARDPSNASVAYQWLRNGLAISGAVGLSYT
ncbi:MAG: CAP domain-containing protein, partial [Bifidobacteriaceae bacterium]|nr:CAP domain-containing protein [Bifidobacteriaceae bacterium]